MNEDEVIDTMFALAPSLQQAVLIAVEKQVDRKAFLEICRAMWDFCPFTPDQLE